MFFRLMVWLAFAWPIASTAQLISAGAHPENPTAVVPPTSYSSAFEGYQPFAEQTVGNWRELNAGVNKQAQSTATNPAPGTEGQTPNRQAPGNVSAREAGGAHLH